VTAHLAQAGGVIAAFGLAALLVAPRRDARIGGLAAWALGCLLLAVYLAPHGHHRLFAAAAVVGVILAAAGAWIVVRVPWLLAVATLACVPARFPVHVGHAQANLLLPMYGVVAVAALALAWELFGDDRRTRELGPLAAPAAVFVAWEGLSILWTKDLRQGSIELLFFVLPFGLLAVALARLAWSRFWVLTLYLQLTAMALVFAVVGIVQYETREIFWNPKVRVDNAYAPSGWFYRVNSVFYDPSIYGRFLVVALLATVVVFLRRRADPLWLVAAALAAGITWVGLLVSFSQSSFVSLIVATLLGAILAWRKRSLFLIGAAVLALVVAGVGSPQVRHRISGKTSSSLSNLTSGRSTLVSRGVKIGVHHPLLGVGVGGFRKADAEEAHTRGGRPSHTTIVTQFAEVGVPGLLIFLWLVVATLALAFRRLGAGFAGSARLAFGLAFAAILVHSQAYNAFFEDPTTWALLALIVVGVRADVLVPPEGRT